MAVAPQDSVEQYREEGVIAGFKKFIARGNMIDMAVGLVMGTAVTTVVTAIVKNIINPLIAMIFGKADISGLLAFTYNNSTISFGAVLDALINFFAVAAAVYFCIVVPINKVRDLSARLVKKDADDAKDAQDAADAAEQAQEAQEQEKAQADREHELALLEKIASELEAMNNK
ncbi:MAG: MscL family protein [Aeriscardovia aeriphila]|nr:MscL family protein [Aeriscardovia aeriphila]